MLRTKLKTIATFSILPVLLFNSIVFAQDQISVYINGSKIQFDEQPVIKDDRTLVPLRAIAEALKADVDWDEETEKITMTKDDITNILFVGQTYAKKITNDDTETINLDVAPFIVNGRTFVPLRYVSESFNVTVTWQEDTKTIILAYPEKILEESEKELPNEPEKESVQPNTKRIIDFGKDKTGSLFNIHNNMRYAFEQNDLPKYVFANKKEVRKLIEENNIKGLNSKIVEVWDKSANTAIIKEIIESDTEYVIASDEQLLSLIEQKRNEFLFQAEKNFELTIQKIDDDSYIAVVDLALLDEMPISSYLGITCYKGEIRYFTLEKGFEEFYMLCTVTESSHSTLGAVENKKQTFINAIKEIIKK